MTYADLCHWGKLALETAGVPEAGLDARLLLEHVCGTARNDLLVHGDRTVDAQKQQAYEGLIARRQERIPLQHLTGVQEFMGLEFAVDEHVLIPRQDTEILVEEVLRNLYDGMRVLDMCTGSGCILISLLHYSNDCEGVGADISEEALAIAQRNAGKLLGVPVRMVRREESGDGKQPREQAVERTGEAGEESGELSGDSLNAGNRGISLIQSDLFERIEGKFDIIVSNPPYIRREVIEGLMPEVGEHEPLLALDGGEDGLVFYRRIVEEGKDCLWGGGMLFLEIGYDQAGEVRKLMEEAGFREINVVKDYAGLDRVVYGTRGFETAGDSVK